MSDTIVETPLIYTSKGNLPIDSLQERVLWSDNDEETVCAHEFWLDKECVKRSVHIYKRQGLNVVGQVGEA